MRGSSSGLLGIAQAEPFAEFWKASGCSVYTFEMLGLPRDLPDRGLWEACQQQQIMLVTANRNQRGPDSLEAVIRQLNTPQSVPVITLANPKRVLTDKAYAQLSAEKLLDYLVFLEKVRGTGRLFVP